MRLDVVPVSLRLEDVGVACSYRAITRGRRSNRLCRGAVFGTEFHVVVLGCRVPAVI